MCRGVCGLKSALFVQNDIQLPSRKKELAHLENLRQFFRHRKGAGRQVYVVVNVPAGRFTSSETCHLADLRHHKRAGRQIYDDVNILTGRFTLS